MANGHGGARPGAGRPSLEELGQQPKAPNGKKVNLYIPNELYARLEHLAGKKGMRVSQLIVWICDRKMKGIPITDDPDDK